MFSAGNNFLICSTSMLYRVDISVYSFSTSSSLISMFSALITASKTKDPFTRRCASGRIVALRSASVWPVAAKYCSAVNPDCCIRFVKSRYKLSTSFSIITAGISTVALSLIVSIKSLVNFSSAARSLSFVKSSFVTSLNFSTVSTPSRFN